MSADVKNTLDFYAAARQAMVEDQIAGRGVKDVRVLDAMRRVPRDRFVPTFLLDSAHDDHPLAIGHEQTISQPYIVALMSEALQLQGTERVLEIGTGSGYQTAILAELAAEVFTVELIPALNLRAESVIGELGYANIRFLVSDGGLGWPEHAPYDAVIVTAGATSLPPAYREQLVEGGRLVIPIGPPHGQVLHRYLRRGEEMIDEDLGHVTFVPLVTPACKPVAAPTTKAV